MQLVLENYFCNFGHHNPNRQVAKLAFFWIFSQYFLNFSETLPENHGWYQHSPIVQFWPNKKGTFFFQQRWSSKRPLEQVCPHTQVGLIRKVKRYLDLEFVMTPWKAVLNFMRKLQITVNCNHSIHPAKVSSFKNFREGLSRWRKCICNY